MPAPELSVVPGPPLRGQPTWDVSSTLCAGRFATVVMSALDGKPVFLRALSGTQYPPISDRDVALAIAAHCKDASRSATVIH